MKSIMKTSESTRFSFHNSDYKDYHIEILSIGLVLSREKCVYLPVDRIILDNVDGGAQINFIRRAASTECGNENMDFSRHC